MKTTKYDEIEPTYIDNDIAKGVAARVLIGKADGADNFCMRVFELSEDGHTPKHSHNWEHEIFVYSGKGAVFSNDDLTPVEPGCSVFIPGNEEHQIKNTGNEPFVFVCIVPSIAPEL
jgi:quercetin dioxygenase-like cupin family protein